jgi:hypothetical protein
MMLLNCTGYIAKNVRIITSNELERICKEAVVVLSQHSG